MDAKAKNDNQGIGLSESIGYALEDEAGGRRTLAALESAFVCRRERTPLRHLVYFDSFDWRLHQQGFRLATRQRDGARTLRLESADFSLEAPLGKKAAPSFGPRLPDGPLKALIAPILEERRLLPLMKVATRSQGIRILDGESKTVARVRLVHCATAPPRSRSAPKPLAPRLTVTPVRGYAAAAERVARFLDAELGLKRASSGDFEAMLASVDQHPGSYSSKLDLPIRREMSAAEALRVICLHLLKTMIANQDGVRRDLDSEFLHDFRVAVRRTRAALTQLDGVFDPQARRIFKSEFKWLGAVTGPARDLDVHLQQMEAYRAALPAQAAGDLDPLASYLRRRRKVEQQALKSNLASQRYRQLLEGWRAYLEGELPDPGVAADAHRPVAEVASRRIMEAHQRLLRIGAGVDHGSPAAELHKLRIRSKKLRYLLEFFHPLYDARAVQPLIKSLKKLQDNLGELNDLAVQQETLKRFAGKMNDEGLASVACLLAMGRLQAHLDGRQSAERQRFPGRFGDFDSVGNRRRFARLFESSDDGER
jgi:CHAD domain-containing protein